MRIIKYVAAILWCVFFMHGIISNASHYKLLDYVIVILIASLPFIIVAVRRIRSRTVPKQKPNNSAQDINISPVAETKNAASPAAPNQDAYIRIGNDIYRADGQAITDKEVPHLMQLGYMQAKEEYANSSNPKFHRTSRDNDLSFRFNQTHGDKVSALEDEFENLFGEALKTENLDEKINKLQDTLAAFHKAKSFCYAKGKGGTIYFQDMWEYQHNSKNSCFSYEDEIKEALQDTIFERDIAIPDIISTISNHDGILQKDIYAMLPHIKRNDIQRFIRKLENNGQVTKIKKKGSYELHISNSTSFVH